MKRKELVDILGIANTCTAENPIAPALSYVSFTGEKIKAFNGIQALSAPFKTDFPFIVQGKFLETFLKSLSSVDVDLSLSGKRLVVESGQMKISLETLDANDFLYVKEDANVEDGYELSPHFFRGLEECLSFASEETVKETQNGVYLIGSEIFSTDGNRVAKSLNGIQGRSTDMFLPEKFCSILLKLKKGVPFTGQLIKSENYIKIWEKDFSLITAIPEITFLTFDYFKKYVQEDKNYFSIPKEMREISDRAALVLGQESKKTLVVLIQDNIWTFSAYSSSSQYNEAVTVDMNYYGEIDFALNLPNFINSLKYVDKLAIFIDSANCFLLFKNSNNDFSAIVAANA